MTVHDYKLILQRSKQIKNEVAKKYEIVHNPAWSYFFAKSILNPKKNIQKIKIAQAKNNSTGDYFSRQITKNQFKDMAKRFTAYVEKNHQLPLYITVSGLKMCVNDYTLMFANIIVYFQKNNKLPDQINVNSKEFIKATEYPNKVYGLWVKYIKTKPKYLDDVCDYVKAHFNYQFYFDDKKSNEEVLKTKAGNCTDLLQMLTNMAEAMDYEWKVIHTQCKVSGTGHVYGKFRKKGTNNWFIRDIACIADESQYCVWCNVDNGKGYQLAINPSWFLENKNR